MAKALVTALRESTGKGEERETNKNQNQSNTSEKTGGIQWPAFVCLTSKQLAVSPNSCKYILDSGSRVHLSGDMDSLNDCKAITPIEIEGISKGHPITVTHSGSITVNMADRNGGKVEVEIHDVYYSKQLEDHVSVISWPILRELGFKLQDSTKSTEISRDGIAVELPKDSAGMIIVTSTRKTSREIGALATLASEQRDMHYRLGHASLKKMNSIRLAQGRKPITQEVSCDVCKLHKTHRAKINREPSTTHWQKAETWGTDIIQPGVESVSGITTLIPFVDYATRITKRYFMPKKNAETTVGTFKLFVEDVKHDFQGKQPIRFIRTDSEYLLTCDELKREMELLGIKILPSAPYHHEQNGRIERKWGAVFETAETMRDTAQLTMKLWPAAVNTAFYMEDIKPISGSAIVHGQHTDNYGNYPSPYELYYDKPPRINHLKIWGCTAYMLKDKKKRKRFEDASTRGILIGYNQENIGTYLIYVPSVSKGETGSPGLYESRDVQFDEKLSEKGRLLHPPAIYFPEMAKEGTTYHKEKTNEERLNELMKDYEQGKYPPALSTVPKSPLQQLLDGTDEEFEGTTTREFYRFRQAFSAFPCTPGSEPKTYKEAINLPDGDRWTIAIDKELEAHAANETWILVNQDDKVKNIVGCKWVFKLKLNPDGTVARYKARLVAQGFSQVYGIDYSETYAPVARYQTLRMLVAIAAAKNLELDQVDVETAYLNSTVTEDIYESSRRLKGTCRRNGMQTEKEHLWTKTVWKKLVR